MSVTALTGVVRDYAWGSPTAIPHLIGTEPDGRPVAELWFGAHPDDPSPTHDGRTLDELVAAGPRAALGAGTIAKFGERLPFLAKILAAGTALSIQVHPTIEQARAGSAREDADGIAKDAANRNYRDENHKPELICALTEFDALCGFRPVPVIRDVLDALKVPELQFIADALDGDDPLRAAFTAVLTHPDPKTLSRLVGERAAGRGETLHGVALAAQDFPGDVGVVLALLLNYVRLKPGEAIFLGAGNVHAYLRGTGIEIMANSDNVLRCGLTPKHIDVPELLAVTDFVPLAEPRRQALGGAFDVPVPDFRLVRIEVDERTTLDDPGPLIVLCAEGSLRVGGVTVAAGHAAFVPADEPAVALDGSGLAFVAGVGT